jgi:hypothetical protein
VQSGRPDAAPVQLVNLILHQRDERRDDQRRAGQEKCRQLKAERLSGTRRHDGQQVVTLDDRLDELSLSVAEGAVTEVLVKRMRKTIVHTDRYFPFFSSSLAMLRMLRIA